MLVHQRKLGNCIYSVTQFLGFHYQRLRDYGDDGRIIIHPELFDCLAPDRLGQRIYLGARQACDVPKGTEP